MDAPLAAGLAALERMRQRRRRTGPVAVCGDRLLVLLAPGSAEEVPPLLHWLGWGHLEGVLVPRQRAAGAAEPTRPWVWLSTEPPAALDLRSQELPRMLDTYADACARALLDGSVSRAPSRRPHAPCSGPDRDR